NGADPRALLTAFRDQSEKYKGKAVSVAPGASLVNDTTGAVIAQGAPKAKTQAELAADAANPQSPTQAQSAAALDRLHPQPVTSRQDKNLLLDGHPAVVSYDPKADKYYRGGQESPSIALSRFRPRQRPDQLDRTAASIPMRWTTRPRSIGFSGPAASRRASKALTA